MIERSETNVRKPRPAESGRARRAAAVLAALALAILFAAEAAACPVCFGEADDQVVDGVRWSVVFLGALVYVLLGGFVAMFLVLRRRARRLQDPRRGLRLVDPGSPG